MKKVYIILTATVVGLFALAGCTQSEQNQTSVQPSTQSSEQSQIAEPTSEQPSNQSQASEQTSEQSSNQSQASEQTSEQPSNQSQASEQTSEQSSNQSQASEQTSEQSSNQSQISEQTSDESIALNSESSSDSKLTLAKVKDIIANNEDFFHVLAEINKIQKPDDESGSGFSFYTYWLNEEHTESIYIVMGTSAGISYRTYDSEGNLLNAETLLFSEDGVHY